MILPRYVFREVLTHLIGVTAVLLLIVVGLQFTRVLARAVADRFPSDVLLTLVAWGAAQNVAVIIPVALLLGIVLALGRLYENHEMAAIEACGAGGIRIYVPVVAVIALAATALAWLTLVYNPQAAAQTEAQKGRALQIGAYVNLRAGEFRSFDGGRFVIYAGRVAEDGTLAEVFAQQLGNGNEAVIVARGGRIERNPYGLPLAIVLLRGTYYVIQPDGLRQRIVGFSEQRVPVHVQVSTQPTTRGDALPTMQLLQSPRPQDLAELQGRLALPAMAIVLGLIALPMSRLRPRQGRYGRVALAIMLYFVYANLLTAGQSWIASGKVPASVGLWWVHGLIGGGAFVVYCVPGWSRRRRARAADRRRARAADGPRIGAAA